MRSPQIGVSRSRHPVPEDEIEQEIRRFEEKIYDCLLVRRIVMRTVVDETSGCWIYNGPKTNNRYTQYGTISVKGRMTVVHRFMYEHLVGLIPDGFELDHVKTRGCTSSFCWNPDHLEPVTHLENIRRSSVMNGDSCRRNHKYTGAVDHRGYRVCLICKNRNHAAQQRRYMSRKKMANAS